mmetsp:Transcript_1932/g.4442  ORF Transcript_1932/g.4442 Transcript_1932/m.4442 type:complete len:288 (-) Transcript_1932:478-1341(-)|eukprot:CAMPEP_0178983762 /NCGR_PEP_ID=MMETSP0795-20121207/1239_1 /TAXON_ID=88552 /ORGANISM="Amoebophrya sp., Strain Ameob2" /LENGTH=287 /DNA_ID=CAMNT_0020674569 /DNA_START=159 /DNA_END=1022 /DNA_ORIENTATION=+
MQKLTPPTIGFKAPQLSAPTQFHAQRRPLQVGSVALAGVSAPKPKGLLFNQGNDTTAHGGHALRSSLLGPGNALQQTAISSANGDSALRSLKSLRQTCMLNQVPVKRALVEFQKFVVDNRLDLGAFTQAYQELMGEFGVGEEPSGDTITDVFRLFDKDKNNVIDPMELCCGLSMLCQGTEDEKIHAVFDCFDENGDGNITLDEMFKFLASVFRVVLTPTVLDTINSLGVDVQSPEDLASVTALECFKSADLDGNGRLNVEEFKTWFNGGAVGGSNIFSGPMKQVLHA